MSIKVSYILRQFWKSARFNFNKTIHNWKVENDQKFYEPYEKVIPKIEAKGLGFTTSIV